MSRSKTLWGRRIKGLRTEDNRFFSFSVLFSGFLLDESRESPEVSSRPSSSSTLHNQVTVWLFNMGFPFPDPGFVPKDFQPLSEGVTTFKN